jgi:hypothetical protein
LRRNTCQGDTGSIGIHEELAERPDTCQRTEIAEIPETLLIQLDGAAGGVQYPDEVNGWRENWNVQSKSVSCKSCNTWASLRLTSQPVSLGTG